MSFRSCDDRSDARLTTRLIVSAGVAIAAAGIREAIGELNLPRMRSFDLICALALCAFCSRDANVSPGTVAF